MSPEYQIDEAADEDLEPCIKCGQLIDRDDGNVVYVPWDRAAGWAFFYLYLTLSGSRRAFLPHHRGCLTG
jgi:hypothetical protein